MTKYKKLYLDKIDSKEELSESELRNLLEYAITHEEGDSGRWTRNTTSLLNIDDRLFILDWAEGLTENQENEFFGQPVEVAKVEDRIQRTTYLVKQYSNAEGKVIFSTKQEVCTTAE